MNYHGKTMVLSKKNYGTMVKTMVIWKKAIILWKNYGTIPKTMELCFAMEKNMVL